MSEPGSARPPRRFRGAIELAVCAAIVALIALHAIWRMDYLSAGGAHTVRMTDNSRSAYVAKNLVDGNGYTTNDLPAALIDFYDERGKLHDAHWENADRFPFTAFAIAALYTVTGSTSFEVGILLYNALCWVAFLVVMFRLARKLWGDRYSPVLALGLALLHPYTYMFIYWKDSDMLLLATASLSAMYDYFRIAPAAFGWKRRIWLGLVLALAFLARPNLGGAFMIFFGGVALHRAWRARPAGVAGAVRLLLRHDGVVAAAVVVVIAPFAIHSMSEWGSPLFSANGIYQLPLGTRFGMGTDTWWKYTEPHHAITLSNLLAEAPGDVAGKFTSSWLVTLKFCLRSYAIELFLACGLGVWLARRARPVDPTPRDPAPATDDGRAFRLLVWANAFAVLLNLALLPLYSYRDFNWRHYISFGLPLLWIIAGHAIYQLGHAVRPQWSRVTDHVRANRAAYILAAIAVVVAWNFGSKGPDANALFVATSRFVGTHWLSAAIVLLALAAHRVVARGSAFPRVVAVTVIVVIARYQPNLEMKHANTVWFAANDRVGAELRRRTGIVSSLALQGEVAWTSGRKNIPAPELVAHLYSYAFDHRLEIEDIYIESAASLIADDGPLGRAAPGFEGYARLQRYGGALPGYERVFHETAQQGNPRFKVKPRAKASTVYRLVDPAARDAFRRSPDQIAIGDPAAVVYTAYGFGDYYRIDDKPVVAATDVTRKRYPAGADQPYADTAVTFFLDDRRPVEIELDVYAPAATTVTVFWNLDLYAYDLPADRGRHRIGEVALGAPGWQTVRLAVPAALARTGVNQLSFRAATSPFVVCPPDVTDEVCLQLRPRDDKLDWKVVARPLRLAGATTVTNDNIAIFLSAIRFRYTP